MTSKRRKRADRRKKQRASVAAKQVQAVVERPKAGPGQVFAREFIDMTSGHAKRFRNVGYSALMLAFYRGQLCSPHDSKIPAPVRNSAEDRFTAGELFEKLWYIVHRTGITDSTVQGISGFTGLFWTEAKEQASDRLNDIRARMQHHNFLIVSNFCGSGFSMAEAVRVSGVDAHPDGVAWRVREALDDLVYATTGRPLSDSIVEKPSANGAGRTSAKNFYTPA